MQDLAGETSAFGFGLSSLFEITAPDGNMSACNCERFCNAESDAPISTSDDGGLANDRQRMIHHLFDRKSVHKLLLLDPPARPI